MGAPGSRFRDLRIDSCQAISRLLIRFPVTIGDVEITYDPKKSERNLRERGLGFEMVSGFDLTTAIYAIDNRKDYGEVRTRALGFIGDALYALVFTMRGSALRVISLRKANRKERNRYAKARP